MKNGGNVFARPSSYCDGISLRDFFAGLYLLGQSTYHSSISGNGCKAIAEQAYDVADAMLAEREKSK